MGKRIEFIKGAFNRPWVRVVWWIFALIGVWDTAGAQFLPRSLQTKWPTIYELAMGLSGFLPWWGWVIAALVLALLVTIEYGVRNNVAFSTGPLIDMKEAVILAYEETRGTRLATIAEGINADDVLGYYAYALFGGGTTLYGNKPPSRKSEPVPNEEYGRCGFNEDYSALRHHDVDQNLYENLKISRADFKRRIAELKAAAGDTEPTKKWQENITWKRWFWAVPAGLAVVGIVAWVFLYPKEIVACNAKFEWLDKIDVGKHKQRGTYLIQYAKITPLTPEPYWMDIKADGGGLVGLAIFQNGKFSQPWQLLPQGIGARFYNPRGGVGIVAFAPKPADVVFKEPEFRCANGTRKIPKP